MIKISMAEVWITTMMVEFWIRIGDVKGFDWEFVWLRFGLRLGWGSLRAQFRIGACGLTYPPLEPLGLLQLYAQLVS